MLRWYLNKPTGTYYHLEESSTGTLTGKSLTVERLDRGNKRAKAILTETITITADRSFLDSDCVHLHKQAVPKRVRRAITHKAS